MRFGILLPTFGEFSEPARLAEFAAEAERHGWDGVFLWDHMAMWWDHTEPVTDSWVALTAVAVATSRVRIGTFITPIPRRRPWKLARETVAVDRLSGGRLVLGVGLGANAHEFEAFGELEGLKARAGMLDEGLAVLAGLWSGEPFEFHGEHYEVQQARFLPTPVQQPRIPIWVAGSWPKQAPFRRAGAWDGAICALAEPGEFNTPVDAVAGIRDLTAAHGAAGRPFDLILTNGNPEWDVYGDAAEIRSYAEVGLTWWLEDISPWRFGGESRPPWPLAAMRRRLQAGPPRLDPAPGERRP
jgi:probable F420-dependent oxidoreductase